MVFIPRWEKYKDKKPSGLVEINYANELAQSIHYQSTFNDLQNDTGQNLLLTGSISLDSGDLDAVNGRAAIQNLEPLPEDFTIASEVIQRTSLSDHTILDVNNQDFIFWLDTASYQLRMGVFSTSGAAVYSPLGEVLYGLESPVATTVRNKQATFYFNGNQTGTANQTFNTTTPWTASNNIYLAANGSNNKVADAIFKYVYVFNRVLSDAEIKSLNENPYQILKPRQSFFVFGATAGTQTLTPSVVTNTSTFYAATISQAGGTQTLTPSVVTSTNTFETAAVTTQNTLVASVVTNTPSFYPVTVSASNSLQPSVVANAQTFHNVTLTTSNSIVVDLYANSASFHSVTVTTSNSLQAYLATNSPSFYSADVTPSNSLQASLLTNTQAFYLPVVSLEGSATLAPSLFVNSPTFYAASITTGSVSLTASLFSNTNTFTTHDVTPTYTLQGSLATNSPSFYTHVMSVGTATLSPNLFSNSNVFYTAQADLGAGLQTLSPSLIVNNNVFYNGVIVYDQTLVAELFVNQPTFYSHVVTSDAQFKPGGVHLLKASSRVFTLKAIERSNFKAY